MVKCFLERLLWRAGADIGPMKTKPNKANSRPAGRTRERRGVGGSARAITAQHSVVPPFQFSIRVAGRMPAVREGETPSTRACKTKPNLGGMGCLAKDGARRRQGGLRARAMEPVGKTFACGRPGRLNSERPSRKQLAFDSDDTVIIKGERP